MKFKMLLPVGVLIFASTSCSDPVVVASCNSQPTIAQADVAFQVGDRLEIAANLAPAPVASCPAEVVWSSSDESVVQVEPLEQNRAAITGAGDGTAHVRAVYPADGASADSIEVTVGLLPL